MAEGPMMLTKEQVNEKSKEVQEMYQQLVQRAQQKVSQWKQKDVAVNVNPWKYARAQNRITFEDIISDPKFAKELFSSAGLQNDETYNKFISDLQTLSNYMDELDTNLQTMINEFSDEF
ncbi:hypothetical protein J7J90_02125, partial [Candidatus Micrarchaeota archaeon]|nr:hypothetical protein [Candidatus Micrarchaeota archaeon]